MFGIFSAFYDVQFQASYHQNWSHSFWWSPSKTLTKLIHYVFSSIIIILFPLSLFYFTLGNCFLFPNSSQSSIFLDNMQRNAALISIMYADKKTFLIKLDEHEKTNKYQPQFPFMEVEHRCFSIIFTIIGYNTKK